MPTCERCGQAFEWRKTTHDKWCPTDPSGRPHFATCPARTRHTHPADVCLKCGSTNVQEGPGTAKHYKSLRCLDCRAHRWLPHPKVSTQTSNTHDR